jgi:hypothetical protein
MAENRDGHTRGCADTDLTFERAADATPRRYTVLTPVAWLSWY